MYQTAGPYASLFLGGSGRACGSGANTRFQRPREAPDLAGPTSVLSLLLPLFFSSSSTCLLFPCS